MIDRDRILVEATRTRRQRLLSALTYGTLPDRRTVTNNVGRFVGSAVLAAVIGAGCLGGSFVVNTLQEQKMSTTSANYRSAIQGTSTPDKDAGVDPRTGYPIDPETGWAMAPDGLAYDTRSGWQVDTRTGRLIDPTTKYQVDPETLQVYPKERT